MLVDSQPNKNIVQKFVTTNAVNTCLLTESSIKKNPNVYISADKGNKKGNKNLAKFICWYDNELKKVKTFLMDTDCSDENTSDVADAIEHSTKRLFSDLPDIKLRGQCTDSGGGGTKTALEKALKQKQLTHEHYLLSTCSLHNLQTALRNGIEFVFGGGGMDENGFKLNCMQMLHGAYNLQNWEEKECLKEMWEFIRDVERGNVEDIPFKALSEPVATRWWLVGECACAFKESIKAWRHICVAIRNSTKSDSSSHQIASCTKNLMDNVSIRADLYFLCGFHQYFMFPHFEHLQLGDPDSGNTPGFQARLMSARYFLMILDLEALAYDKWREREEFRDYKVIFDALDDEKKELQRKKFTYAIQQAKNAIDKHFNIWIEIFFQLCFRHK